ncbi:hypothetical protein [Ferrimonas pelagia]|uniref:Uncharacterized protein n=1 Tax=Ferrimonas pelagia TaxID=1177826 RepID=A0ABP9EFZ0_9GAMM
MSNPQLEDAFRSALIELEQEKKVQTELTTNTRSHRQMKNYLTHLEWSDKQLLTLQAAIEEILTERREYNEKAERVQTYRAKLINLARDLNMSYQELVTTMADLESLEGKKSS